MSRTLVNRYSDFPVTVEHPIDQFNNVVLNDDAGASSLFKVFDPSKDSVTSALEASGQTVLSMINAGVFVVGDKVECNQDDGTIHSSTINTVDPVLNTITIANATTDSMAAGSRVRVIMGVAVAMLEYGTADLDTLDWGYVASFPNDHAAHLDARAKNGFDVDLEIQFDGGASLAAVEIHCLTIKEKICV